MNRTCRERRKAVIGAGIFYVIISYLTQFWRAFFPEGNSGSIAFCVETLEWLPRVKLKRLAQK